MPPRLSSASCREAKTQPKSCAQARIPSFSHHIANSGRGDQRPPFAKGHGVAREKGVRLGWIVSSTDSTPPAGSSRRSERLPSYPRLPPHQSPPAGSSRRSASASGRGRRPTNLGLRCDKHTGGQGGKEGPGLAEQPCLRCGERTGGLCRGGGGRFQPQPQPPCPFSLLIVSVILILILIDHVTTNPRFQNSPFKTHTPFIPSELRKSKINIQHSSIKERHPLDNKERRTAVRSTASSHRPHRSNSITLTMRIGKPVAAFQRHS